MPPEGVFVALGANLGDPLKSLRWARRALAEVGRLEGASSLYRTAPVGGPPGQPDYLNAVLELAPFEACPERFLEVLLELERRYGRVRTERWGPRTLDLDLLAWGERVQQSPTLVLPHPRMMGRAFVLAPLCELAPAWRHPVTGLRACEVLQTCADASGVVKTKLSWD
jgi:2-amino-4-hydroxy-6-hydroxymethyldihydropteridine diphosphokinase